MEALTINTLLGSLGGGLAGLLLVFIFHKMGMKLGERVATNRVISDRHLQPMFGTPISGWSRAWAWKPVHTLDHGYIWLRVYWRRRIHKKQHLDGGADFWWQNIQKLTYVFREQQPAPVKRGLVDPELWP